MTINWQLLLIKLGEQGTYKALALALAGVGFQLPDETWRHIAFTGMALSAATGVFLPIINSPIRTDIGAARTSAGQSLLSVAQLPSAPVGTALVADASPVHSKENDTMNFGNLGSLLTSAANLLHIGSSTPQTVATEAPAINDVIKQSEDVATAAASVAGGKLQTYVAAGEDLVNECIAFAESKGVQEAKTLVQGLFGIVADHQVKAAQQAAAPNAANPAAAQPADQATAYAPNPLAANSATPPAAS